MQTILARPAILVAALIGLATGAAVPTFEASAQTATRSLLDPLVLVDGRPVTMFEFEQRQQFLRVLGASGDLGRQAEAALIEERLQLAEAARLGIDLGEAELGEGLAEFAGRAGLGVDDFVRALFQAGIAPQTYRDFVRAGLIWRKVVRARFGAAAAEITEAEIDREVSTLRQRSGVMLSLSEIVVAPEQAEALARLAAAAPGPEAFADAARTRSIVPSAARGGRLAPVPAAYLGPQAEQALTALPVGSVSAPLRVPEGVVVYFKHAAEPFAAPTPRITEVDVAVLASATAEDAALAEAARRLRAEGVSECAALLARGPQLVAGVIADAEVRRGRSLLADLPPGMARVLAGLDEGELAPRLQAGTAPQAAGGSGARSGDGLVDGRAIVMLCARRLTSGLSSWAQAEDGVADGARVRGAVRDAIASRRLVESAGLYLADLRANARIERP
jgi:peptidyl-prolyl cis-trans isomerase SurA